MIKEIEYAKLNRFFWKHFDYFEVSKTSNLNEKNVVNFVCRKSIGKHGVEFSGQFTSLDDILLFGRQLRRHGEETDKCVPYAHMKPYFVYNLDFSEQELEESRANDLKALAVFEENTSESIHKEFFVEPFKEKKSMACPLSQKYEK